MTSHSYSFFVTDQGMLPTSIRQTLANVVPLFKGMKVKLTIALHKDKRSLSQNDYYHAAVIPAVRLARFDMGDPVTLDECHEDLLAQFAPAVTARKSDGGAYARPKRSKELNTEEFANYITAIQGFFGQLGHIIPEAK